MREKSEEEEFLDELANAWVEMYKKSATTLMLLRLVEAGGPTDTATIGRQLAQDTGWELTERGLYRTLRRLTAQGLLTVDQQPGRRTGAQRHVYEISERGASYLRRIEAAVVS